MNLQHVELIKATHTSAEQTPSGDGTIASGKSTKEAQLWEEAQGPNQSYFDPEAGMQLGPIGFCGSEQPTYWVTNSMPAPHDSHSQFWLGRYIGGQPDARSSGPSYVGDLGNEIVDHASAFLEYAEPDVPLGGQMGLSPEFQQEQAFPGPFHPYMGAGQPAQAGLWNGVPAVPPDDFTFGGNELINSPLSQAPFSYTQGWPSDELQSLEHLLPLTAATEGRQIHADAGQHVIAAPLHPPIAPLRSHGKMYTVSVRSGKPAEISMGSVSQGWGIATAITGKKKSSVIINIRPVQIVWMGSSGSASFDGDNTAGTSITRPLNVCPGDLTSDQIVDAFLLGKTVDNKLQKYHYPSAPAGISRREDINGLKDAIVSTLKADLKIEADRAFEAPLWPTYESGTEFSFSQGEPEEVFPPSTDHRQRSTLSNDESIFQDGSAGRLPTSSSSLQQFWGSEGQMQEPGGETSIAQPKQREFIRACWAKNQSGADYKIVPRHKSYSSQDQREAWPAWAISSNLAREQDRLIIRTCLVTYLRADGEFQFPDSKPSSWFTIGMRRNHYAPFDEVVFGSGECDHPFHSYVSELELDEDEIRFLKSAIRVFCRLDWNRYWSARGVNLNQEIPIN
ncbi:hypothetical protein QFC22_005290 [Naganishia vaughanmartiniae]|uniref:Uncharacterized protein n=1 Tax=Naganishia vaughanmartiniae TaxID=1424756 RepID=A0ACC2WVJ2_9TREE|nr:hypothetical protein QFC22_005290 [Naganishia vaughanmartiniae]